MEETKKILLVDPPQNVIYRGREKMYPSGALILIGTMCRNKGHNVKFIGMEADGIGISKLRNTVLSYKPDIVGVTINTFQTKFAKKVAKAVKDVDKNILVVAGGPHPSSIGLKIFDDFPYIDISVIGEGEFAFLEIVEGRELEEIKGICYNGKMNELRPLTENLDYLPLPNLDLVDLGKYRGWGVGEPRSMYIMASRGCPFNCIFCNKSIFGSTVRFRKPSKVIEEIKWLHEEFNISKIYFQDDTFNLKRSWTKEILNLIINQNLNKDITYVAPFRANRNLVDKELLQLAKDAGFEQIFYGVESGNQEMLDKMHKGLTVAEIKRAFELTQEIGLKTIASFMIGLPGENKESIEDTINLWRELKSPSGFALATPFPNTEFERIVREKEHLLNANYDEYHYGGSYVRTDELNRKELKFYYAIVTFGREHVWIFNFPIYTIAQNKLLCEIYHIFNFFKTHLSEKHLD